MISNFLTYIKEIFNTKNYVWIKKTDLENVAKFYVYGNEYFVNIDSIGPNSYHLYFYLLEDGKRTVHLLDRKDHYYFKVLSNVKHIVEDFFENNEVNFFGFSTFEDERIPLYTLFLENISKKGYIPKTKEGKEKLYFYMYKKEFSMYEDYILKYLIQDDLKKKQK